MSKTVKPKLIPNFKLIKTVVNPNHLPNLDLSDNVSSPKCISNRFLIKTNKRSEEYKNLSSEKMRARVRTDLIPIEATYRYFRMQLP